MFQLLRAALVCSDSDGLLYINSSVHWHQGATVHCHEPYMTTLVIRIYELQTFVNL